VFVDIIESHGRDAELGKRKAPRKLKQNGITVLGCVNMTWQRSLEGGSFEADKSIKLLR
jgi:hypothetical protein